jgi:hypothetical protein
MKFRICKAYSAIPAVGKGGNVGLQVKATEWYQFRLYLGLIMIVETLNHAHTHNPYSSPFYMNLATTNIVRKGRKHVIQGDKLVLEVGNFPSFEVVDIG